MPPSAKEQKMKAAAAQKKIEDKTFGMKNKNKSKQVQQQIAVMKQTAGIAADKDRGKGDKERKAAEDAMNAVLFKEAVTKKELARRALEKAKEKAEKAEKAKAAEKRDIYTDMRDVPKELDDMSTWDDAKLKEVVDSKKGGQGERCKTDIICKFFLDAVEKRTYGWFWTCPNGGDKCQYRHALPEGYVLKRDKVDEVVDQGPRLEEVLEEKRKALTGTRTPVTLERLQEWLAKKKAVVAAAEAETLEAARKQYAKGKAAGVTGRMLFDIDKSLFVDDAAASGDKYVREDSEDEDEGEEGEGERSAAGSGAAGGAGASSSGALPAAERGTVAASTPAVGGGSMDGSAYSMNYADSACTGGATGSSSSAPVDLNAPAPGEPAAPSTAVDVTDIDESLFLDEDLPDDDEL
jgi:hypothetical protein